MKNTSLCSEYIAMKIMHIDSFVPVDIKTQMEKSFFVVYLNMFSCRVWFFGLGVGYAITQIKKLAKANGASSLKSHANKHPLCFKEIFNRKSGRR